MNIQILIHLLLGYEVQIYRRKFNLPKIKRRSLSVVDDLYQNYSQLPIYKVIH